MVHLSVPFVISLLAASSLALPSPTSYKLDFTKRGSGLLTNFVPNGKFDAKSFIDAEREFVSQKYSKANERYQVNLAKVGESRLRERSEEVQLAARDLIEKRAPSTGTVPLTDSESDFSTQVARNCWSWVRQSFRGQISFREGHESMSDRFRIVLSFRLPGPRRHIVSLQSATVTRPRRHPP